MSDSLNRLLKKGRGEEQALAARLTAILMLQIATSDEDPDIEGQLHTRRRTDLFVIVTRRFILVVLNIH